jgi:hypothetical protein
MSYFVFVPIAALSRLAKAVYYAICLRTHAPLPSLLDRGQALLRFIRQIARAVKRQQSRPLTTSIPIRRGRLKRDNSEILEGC